MSYHLHVLAVDELEPGLIDDAAALAVLVREADEVALVPVLEGLVEDLAEQLDEGFTWSWHAASAGRVCAFALPFAHAVEAVEAIVAAAAVRGLAVHDPQAGGLVPLPPPEQPESAARGRRRWWRR